MPDFNWPHETHYTTQHTEQFGAHNVVSFGRDKHGPHYGVTFQAGMASLNFHVAARDALGTADVLRRLADAIEYAHPDGGPRRAARKIIRETLTNSMGSNGSGLLEMAGWSGAPACGFSE